MIKLIVAVSPCFCLLPLIRTYPRLCAWWQGVLAFSNCDLTVLCQNVTFRLCFCLYYFQVRKPPVWKETTNRKSEDRPLRFPREHTINVRLGLGT